MVTILTGWCFPKFLQKPEDHFSKLQSENKRLETLDRTMSNLQKHRLSEFDLKGPSVIISNLQCYSCNPSPLSWWSSPPSPDLHTVESQKFVSIMVKKSQICILMTAVLHVKILVNTLNLRCQHSVKKLVLCFCCEYCPVRQVSVARRMSPMIGCFQQGYGMTAIVDHSPELTEPKIGHCC